MKRTNPFRYLFLGGLFFIVCLVFAVRLARYQLAGTDRYDYARVGTYTRRETVTAQRGEILDRNGVPLVTNSYYYNVLLDYGRMPDDAEGFNRVILSVVRSAARCGETDKLTGTNWPLALEAGKRVFTADYQPEGKYRERLIRLLRDLGYEKKQKKSDPDRPAEEATPDAVYEFLLSRYKLVDGDGAALYTPEEQEILLARRYDLGFISFSPVNSYTFAERVSARFMTLVTEGGEAGVLLQKKFERVYRYPGYASHILGRMGSITEETADYYKEKGYALDEPVGVSGAEKVFEDYLRGKDGVRVIREDSSGNIVDQYMEKEPEPGKDIRLTIDIELQKIAEDSLAAQIVSIAESALEKPGELDGEDADAGACVALSPKTGEVLAIASCPTYDLSTFVEDLPALLGDGRTPLVNRALNGLYPPGSTFKPATAAASLADGVITPYTVINDTGIYDYYEDYQPRCWSYWMYGYAHGQQTVVDAIHNSCNYFFFECGRRLTIERLNYYCRGFGLGEPTGVEYPEATGILAGPAYVESSGLGTWSPGDTLQAAIGQSYNTFTPIQIATYLATLVNNGTRYRSHLLYGVYRYGTGEELSRTRPEVVSRLNISSDVIGVVKEAMKNSEENGSTAAIFRNYPITMGGKTGTAQITKTSSDNGVFVAFAPLEEPEVVMAAVIEHAASGTPIGAVAKDIFDFYFHLNGGEG